MSSRYFYFLTSLPPLGTLGEPPPTSLAAVYASAADEPGLGDAIAAILLEHDLLARQSVLAGESEQVEPAVLTGPQVRGEAALPDELAGPESSDRPAGEDGVWEAYFRHVAAVAQETDCEFLRRYVGFEVALRNALVVARAKLLEVPPDGFFVARDLADGMAPTERIVADWSAAGDPLQAQRALDEGRWRWLMENNAWFDFSIDEAAAYARGLVLLERWHRVTLESDASSR